MQEKLQYVAIRKAMVVLLNSAHIQLINCVARGETSAEFDVLWHEFSRDDAQPFSRILLNIPIEERNHWLMNCLRLFGLQQEYYLSVGGRGDINWVRVNVDSQGLWLSRLWSTEQVADLIILDCGRSRALGFIETEYELLALGGEVEPLRQQYCARSC